MNESCLHHEHCDQFQRPVRSIQRRFLFKGGMLSLTPVPPRRVQRSPLPKSIRNIANVPFFSTSDRSLTSFLRFPPEIRIQIYCYFLLCPYNITYQICPYKGVLILCGRTRFGWIRHGLFPSILECCKTINLEGSNILYGRNVFRLEPFATETTRWSIIKQIWTPGLTNINAITRLRVYFQHAKEGFVKHSCSQHNKKPSMFKLFPHLREVIITCYDFYISEWEALLAEISGELVAIKSVSFNVDISSMSSMDFIHRHPSAPLGTAIQLLIDEYEAVIRRVGELCRGRRIEVTFEDETEEFSRSHGVWGQLKVMIN
jgi:hypothetical protein